MQLAWQEHLSWARYLPGSCGANAYLDSCFQSVQLLLQLQLLVPNSPLQCLSLHCQRCSDLLLFAPVPSTACLRSCSGHLMQDLPDNLSILSRPLGAKLPSCQGHWNSLPDHQFSFGCLMDQPRGCYQGQHSSSLDIQTLQHWIC